MTPENQEPHAPPPGPTEHLPAAAQQPATDPAPDTVRPLSERVAGLARRKDWRIAAPILLLGGLFLVWRAVSVHAKAHGKAETAPQLVPVAVAKVARQDLYNEVTFPAEFRPYVEVELHAKVSGYVRDMNVDFGDHVKAGQLLATLEVPELHDELHNAIATQQKAEADYTNAHLIYQRLAAVNKDHPNLVAQQDLDTADAKDRTTLAAIAAAKALAEKYQTLVDYTRITAPFDGVVTKRYADPGTLIQAGTSSDTQSMPLVRVSDNYLLRLDFPVDVMYVKDIHVGGAVHVRVESLGGKTFTGKITRATERVTEDTRTMITEIEVPNPKLEIVPGMYAWVTLKVQGRPNALCIPMQAVSAEQRGAKAKEKGTVFVVDDDGKVEERAVTLGLETPNRYEVTAGLREGELVMTAGRGRVQPGQTVTPVITQPLTYD